MGSDPHPGVRQSRVLQYFRRGLNARLFLFALPFIIGCPALFADSADAQPAPAASPAINGWIVIGLIFAVLAAGLYAQSTRRRIR